MADLVVTEFEPQQVNDVAQLSYRARRAIAPDLLQDLIVRHDPSLVLSQDAQNFKLQPRQRHAPSIQADLIQRQVDHKGVMDEGERFLLLRARATMGFGYF